MKTGGFRFVDIINYLGPGTSYEKWVKAYGFSVQKSYKWFDTPEKLQHPGMPLLPSMVFPVERGICLDSFRIARLQENIERKGNRTFADRLRYYNDLDVAPRL